MALDKNKAGIMAAIQAATEAKAPLGKAGAKGSQARGAEQDSRAHRSLPKGTVGSVRAGLGGIQEITTDLIMGWGPQDRIELTAVNSDTLEDFENLVASLQSNGQQVPVLLRPAAEKDGYFEVIYGRRRILACQHLGIPVKALVRTLDDGAALMAKGLENASRVDLSFYERARFAMDILDQGYSREEAMQALSISKNSLSQLERVARLIPDRAGYEIGAAHKAGRPKWMTLAAAFEKNILDEDVLFKMLKDVPTDATSDERLDYVLSRLSARGAREDRAIEREPVAGLRVKSSATSLSFSVRRKGKTKEFADWLDVNLDRLIQESYQTYKNESDG